MLRMLKFLQGEVDVHPPDLSKFNLAPGQQSADSLSEHDDDEEEVTVIPGWVPSLTLEVMGHAMLGEEDEEQLYCQRCKLFRFSCETWNDCGVGDAKLLKHKVTGNVRFLFRVEKTMKILANHGLCETMPYCDLKRHTITPNCRVWMAPDCSTGTVTVRRLALKFKSEELVTAFQERFNRAKGQSKQDHDHVNSLSELVGAQVPTVLPSGGHAEITRRTRARNISSEPRAEIMPDFVDEEVNQDGHLTKKAVLAETFFDAISELSSGQASASQSSHDLHGDSASCDEGDDASCHSFEDDGLGGIARVPGWSPSMALDVAIGEESEKEMYRQRAKLFRFRDGSWNFCGVGYARLLTNNVTAQSRFVFRLPGTMQIVANHYIIDCLPYCDLQQTGTSERCWLWAALDCASVPTQATQFALKFDNEQLATDFKDVFEEVKTPSPEVHNKLKGSDGSAVRHDDWMQFEAFFGAKPHHRLCQATHAQSHDADGLKKPVDQVPSLFQQPFEWCQQLLSGSDMQGEQLVKPMPPLVCPAAQGVQLQQVELVVARSDSVVAEGLHISRDEVEPPQKKDDFSTNSDADAMQVEFAGARSEIVAVENPQTPPDEAGAPQQKGGECAASSAVAMQNKAGDTKTMTGKRFQRKCATSFHSSHDEVESPNAVAMQNQVKSTSASSGQPDADTNSCACAERFAAAEMQTTSAEEASAPQVDSHTQPEKKRGSGSEAEGMGTFEQDPHSGSCKARKTDAEHSPHKAAATQAQLALAYIAELLMEANSIDTNEGSVHYKEIVESAMEIAMMARSRSDLPARIHDAAFAPCPRTGTWASNTPTCHQKALKKLITAFGVISVIEFLHAAVDIDTNHGNTECYLKTVQRARDIAETIDISHELSERIQTAAFAQIPGAGKWMPNFPSCHRRALLGLVRILSVAEVKKLLDEASGIDTNLGSARYKELVQQAQDIAAASKTDTSLPARIANAAFKVLPRAGRWMANTPSWHRAALQEFSRGL